jgi:hypothetical protein
MVAKCDIGVENDATMTKFHFKIMAGLLLMLAFGARALATQEPEPQRQRTDATTQAQLGAPSGAQFAPENILHGAATFVAADISSPSAGSDMLVAPSVSDTLVPPVALKSAWPGIVGLSSVSLAYGILAIIIFVPLAPSILALLVYIFYMGGIIVAAVGRRKNRKGRKIALIALIMGLGITALAAAVGAVGFLIFLAFAL